MVAAIELKLKPMEEIDSIIYISKEKAIEEFQKEFDLDITEILGENPLPPSFRIQLKPEFHEKDKVEQLQKEFEEWQGVEEVIYRYDLLNAVQQYLKTTLIISFILGSILLVASVLLISNTIRLSILVKKNSIKIMSLVGATPAFIRRPFILEGAIQGAVGALIAIGGIFLIVKMLSLFFHLFKIDFGFIPIGLILWAIFLGVLGSWVAIHRHLRL
jgi:cell division transport system permease protein